MTRDDTFRLIEDCRHRANFFLTASALVIGANAASLAIDVRALASSSSDWPDVFYRAMLLIGIAASALSFLWLLQASRSCALRFDDFLSDATLEEKAKELDFRIRQCAWVIDKAAGTFYIFMVMATAFVLIESASKYIFIDIMP